MDIKDKMHTPAPSTAVWGPPDGVAVRGTVVVLPGRGENAAVYERFGRRLASDGYTVHVFVSMSPDHQVNALGWLALDTEPPLVVIGSDVGALEALAASAELPEVLAGLVLAGIPSATTNAPSPWVEELDSRTACPVHRARLEAEAVRGALGGAPVREELLLAARRARPTIPVLVLHGSADAISPVAGARRLAARIPSARCVVVEGGRHDVLNDVSHRSVAAEIVQFLERIRSSQDAMPILRVEVG